MNADLRRITSPDIDSMEIFVPPDEKFCYLLQAFIGPNGDEGEESFEFIVCSPKWLEFEVEKENFIFGKGMLIMSEFNFFRVKGFLSALCKRTHGNSWSEIANKLSRFATWEFEER